MVRYRSNSGTVWSLSVRCSFSILLSLPAVGGAGSIDANALFWSSSSLLTSEDSHSIRAIASSQVWATTSSGSERN